MVITMNNDKRRIRQLIEELDAATRRLNKLGYFACPVCGEFEELEDEEICSSCQRKVDQSTLIRERNE